MEVLDKIKKAIKKRNERIIIDLYIRDYDRSNFYFALVFNKKIEKFKMLFVPLDVIDTNNVEEYFCYQFVFLHSANYVLETMRVNECDYMEEEKRLLANKDMDSYYLEVNYSGGEKEYKFNFSQYLPKNYLFMFEIINLFFENSPSILHELGYKILSRFNVEKETFYYNNSFNFSLLNGDLGTLFDEEIIKKCKYEINDINFLEANGNRYYAVLNRNLFVIDVDEFKSILSIASFEKDVLGEEVYIILKAMKEKYRKEFYRLKVNVDEDIYKYYLCYGIDSEDFIVIDEKCNNRVGLDYLKYEKVEILNWDDKLKEELKEFLSETYENKRVKEILNSSLIKKN